MKSLFPLLVLLLATVPRFAVEPPIKPDPKLTPGAVLEVSREDLCTPGYTKKVLNVAGPRASSQPGIEEFVRKVLKEAFTPSAL